MLPIEDVSRAVVQVEMETDDIRQLEELLEGCRGDVEVGSVNARIRDVVAEERAAERLEQSSDFASDAAEADQADRASRERPAGMLAPHTLAQLPVDRGDVAEQRESEGDRELGNGSTVRPAAPAQFDPVSLDRGDVDHVDADAHLRDHPQRGQAREDRLVDPLEGGDCLHAALEERDQIVACERASLVVEANVGVALEELGTEHLVPRERPRGHRDRRGVAQPPASRPTVCVAHACARKAATRWSRIMWTSSAGPYSPTFVGACTTSLAISPRRPPSNPVSPTVTAPLAFAYSTAASTFGEFPETEIATTTSPGAICTRSWRTNTSS